MNRQTTSSSAFYPGAVRYGGSSAIAKRREAARKDFFNIRGLPPSSSTSLRPSGTSSNGPVLVHNFTINSNDIIRREATEPQLTSTAKRIFNWIEENSAATVNNETVLLTKRQRTKHRFNPMLYKAPKTGSISKIQPIIKPPKSSEPSFALSATSIQKPGNVDVIKESFAVASNIVAAPTLPASLVANPVATTPARLDNPPAPAIPADTKTPPKTSTPVAPVTPPSPISKRPASTNTAPPTSKILKPAPNKAPTPVSTPAPVKTSVLPASEKTNESKTSADKGNAKEKIKPEEPCEGTPLSSGMMNHRTATPATPVPESKLIQSPASIKPVLPTISPVVSPQTTITQLPTTGSIPEIQPPPVLQTAALQPLFKSQTNSIFSAPAPKMPVPIPVKSETTLSVSTDSDDEKKTAHVVPPHSHKFNAPIFNKPGENGISLIPCAKRKFAQPKDLKIRELSPTKKVAPTDTTPQPPTPYRIQPITTPLKSSEPLFVFGAASTQKQDNNDVSKKSPAAALNVTAAPVIPAGHDTTPAPTSDWSMDIDMDPPSSGVLSTVPTEAPSLASTPAPATTPVPVSTPGPTPTPITPALPAISSIASPQTTMTQSPTTGSIPKFQLPSIMQMPTSQPLFMSPTTSTFTAPTFTSPVPPPVPSMTGLTPTTGLTLPNGSNPFQPAASSVRGRKILRPNRRLHR